MELYKSLIIYKKVGMINTDVEFSHIQGFGRLKASTKIGGLLEIIKLFNIVICFSYNRIVSDNSSLQFTPEGCNDIGFSKFEIVTKTQFLSNLREEFCKKKLPKTNFLPYFVSYDKSYPQFNNANIYSFALLEHNICNMVPLIVQN